MTVGWASKGKAEVEGRLGQETKAVSASRYGGLDRFGLHDQIPREQAGAFEVWQDAVSYFFTVSVFFPHAFNFVLRF